MIPFRIASRGLADIEEIWSYHADKIGDVALAERVCDEIFQAILKISRSPGIGHLRSDLTRKPLRFWKVRKYLIMYRESEREVTVARILHSARNIQSVMNPRMKADN